MAAIFQKNLRNTFIANTCSLMNSIYNPPNLSGGASPTATLSWSGAITFWGGVQPSAADVKNNWVASYKTTYLLHLPGLTLQGNNLTTPDVGILIVNSTSPTATTAFNSGTITWALIWNYGVTASDIASGSATPTSYPKYIIVPVSDTSGTYPVRLPTLTVATGATTYTLGDVSITAGGGIA